MLSDVIARGAEVSVLRPGQVLQNPATGLRVIVLRGAPDDDSPAEHLLENDGSGLVVAGPLGCSCQEPSDAATGLVPGGRYADKETGVTVRCLVPAGRELTLDGRPMHINEMQPGTRLAARSSETD